MINRKTMKKLLITLALIISSATISAQVPFFGTSPEKTNIYTYTQLEVHPGENQQGMFIFSHIGITDRFSAGFEVIGGTGYMVQGFNLKYQFVAQKYLNLALQTTTRMDLNNSYHFSEQNISLFLNGMITKSLGYITNTYCNISREGKFTSYQYWYLSYNIKRVTMFLGETNNWTGDVIYADLAVGVGVNLGKVNIYGWGGSFIHGTPAVTIGIDYQFSCGKGN